MKYDPCWKREEIHKGWSEDRKYCVTDENGNRFLLRVSPAELFERKKAEFALMQQVAARKVPMCKPLDFGTSGEGVYSLQSWVDGVDLESVLAGFSEDAQYRYGMEAGRILKTIHTIPAPPDQPDWEARFNR